jgi:hypothetical protein
MITGISEASVPAFTNTFNIEIFIIKNWNCNSNIGLW